MSERTTTSVPVNPNPTSSTGTSGLVAAILAPTRQVQLPDAEQQVEPTAAPAAPDDRPVVCRSHRGTTAADRAAIRGDAPSTAAPAAPSPEVLAKLAALPLYATARPEVQALIRQDMAGAVGEGLEEAVYLDGVQTWGGTAEELLAEAGVQVQPSGAEVQAEVEQMAPAVQQSAEAVAKREEEARDQADATRAAAVKAYRKGEAAYSAGLLESGRLCGVYIGQRLALGDKREVAVKALEGDLSRYSSTEVDVNRLVRTFQAWHLLAVSQGLTEKPAKGKPAPADGIPYGQVRDRWVRLVERVASGREESYALLPGIEAACRSMFRRAVRDELSTKAAGELVAKLVRAYAGRQARAEKARLSQATAKAAAERAALERQAAELRAAREEHDKAAAAAKAKGDEQTAAALAESAAKLQAQQKATLEAQARAEQAEREKAAADKRAKAEAERLDRESRKAEAKAAKQQAQAAERPATSRAPAPAGNPKPANPADARGVVVGNILRTAADSSPKQAAEFCCEYIGECEQPDDVFEHLLRLLKASGELSKASVRAIDAALVVLTRKDAPKPPAGPSPVEVANRLAGQPAPAAA